MEARKFFLLQNDRFNPFAEQEHRCRRTTGATTNNEYVCFHNIKELK